MGAIYLANDTILPRQAALKVLPESLAHDKERLGRFEREAHAVSALNHPNILTVYEFGLDGEIHYLATEYVDGKTLREEMQQGDLSLVEALAIAEQSALALSASHTAGVIHRDIKPENIMIRNDRIVKVLDFGLVKLTDDGRTMPDAEAPTRMKTGSGIIMGTVAYMSPEQARGKPLDERTDIWSLGVVLYEMITGKLPFDGETPNDVIAAILTKEPAPIAAGCPKDLERIVGRTLRKSADERYQNIKDLLIDVRELKQEFLFEARHSVPPLATAEPQTQTFAKNQSTAALAAASKTNDLDEIHQTSSAEYVVTEIKRHKTGLFIAAAALLLAMAAVAFWFTRSDGIPTNQVASIAVLPFENGSGDAGLDYFSDGLSESLIDRLSQLPQLKVIARNSSFKYRGSDIDLKAAALALGVQAIVIGKVIRIGDSLTVRVEMIDAAENRQLWSEQYNRKISDVLSVQQEIAHAASEKLRVKLSGTQEQQLSEMGTTNPQAYELLLKGRHIGNTAGPGNRQKAIDYFQQAIAIDPNYALAYTEVSRGYSLLINNSVLDPKEYQPKVEAAARKALELDPYLAETHLAMARVHTDAWDWKAAEQDYERAIELKPNLGTARAAYSSYLGNVGRHDEAVTQAKTARELDPLSQGTNVTVGLALYTARRFDEAIEWAPRVMELSKPWGYLVLGYSASGKGLYKEAITHYEQSIAEGNSSPSVQIYLGAAYARAGETHKAEAILASLRSSKKYVSPAELAVLFAGLGRIDEAFQSLEKGFAEHDIQLKYLKSDCSFDPLRDDPRLSEMIKRVGLPL